MISAFEDSIPIVEDSNVFDNVQLILKYKITRSGNKIVVSFFAQYQIIDNLNLQTKIMIIH